MLAIAARAALRGRGATGAACRCAPMLAAASRKLLHGRGASDVHSHLLSVLGNERDVEALLRKHPPLSESDAETVGAASAFLRRKIRLAPEAVASAVRLQPALLLRPDHLELSHACVRSLFDELGARHVKLAPLYRTCPEVLLAEPGEMRAIVAELGRVEADVLTLLLKNFPLLSMPRRRVAEVLAFVEAEIGARGAACGELVSAYPALLGMYSLDEGLRPLVTYLRELGLDPSSSACAPLFAWTHAEPTLRRGVELLTSAGYARAYVLAEPALCCYSFELRLLPRTALARRMLERGELRSLPPLRHLATDDDAGFARRLGVELGVLRDEVGRGGGAAPAQAGGVAAPASRYKL